MLAPLVMTGCASNHLGFGGKKKSTTVAYPMSERTCLMRAMYFESNRSSRDGMIAVGTVVMNRVNSTAYPKTICGVVGQPNQFAPGVLTKPMERSGNVPQFTTPGRTQPVVAAPKAAPEQPAPVMVAQAGPIPVQNRAEPVHVKPAQEKYVHHEEMIIPFQTAPTPPPPSHHVVAEADRSKSKSSRVAIDKTQTGSISVGYPIPSKQKIDEVGAILKQQGKSKKK